MLAYMSDLNLLSNWTCFSIASITLLTKKAFGKINPESLVTVFLGANAMARAVAGAPPPLPPHLAYWMQGNGRGAMSELMYTNPSYGQAVMGQMGQMGQMVNATVEGGHNNSNNSVPDLTHLLPPRRVIPSVLLPLGDACLHVRPQPPEQLDLLQHCSHCIADQKGFWQD
jgi:hypothetical protein